MGEQAADRFCGGRGPGWVQSVIEIRRGICNLGRRQMARSVTGHVHTMGGPTPCAAAPCPPVHVKRSTSAIYLRSCSMNVRSHSASASS